MGLYAPVRMRVLSVTVIVPDSGASSERNAQVGTRRDPDDLARGIGGDDGGVEGGGGLRRSRGAGAFGHDRDRVGRLGGSGWHVVEVRHVDGVRHGGVVRTDLEGHGRPRAQRLPEHHPGIVEEVVGEAARDARGGHVAVLGGEAELIAELGAVHVDRHRPPLALAERVAQVEGVGRGGQRERDVLAGGGELHGASVASCPCA